MAESKEQMQENIRNLFLEDLRLLEGGIPSNGIWAHCSLLDTEYQGAVRIIPSESEKGVLYLWVDVFRTIYDPIYSNTLFKGSKEEVRQWLQDQTHVAEVYDCMHHLHMLAEDD